MAEDKKISQLNPASAFTGVEKFEIVQSGLNLYGTPEQMKNYVGGTTREFNRAFSAEILFDKNEIAYAEHELTGDLEYTVAPTGHLENQFSSATQIVETDGTRTVTFTGFNFVLGDIQSGTIPDAGTYLVLFLYWNGIATVNWTKPSLEVANLTPLAAPANFAAVPGAGDPETEVDLSWDAVANVSSYEIYYSTTGGSGPWISLTNPVAAATSYTHTGLTAGTTYHYRIRAIGDQVVFSNSGYVTDAATTEDAGDMTAPTFTFDPADTDTDIPINGVMVITASAPLRDQDGVTAITDANVASYITAVNSSAAAQPFTATIDATKTIITITPNVVWTELDDITITIDGVESSVNGVHAVSDSATFSTSDFTLTQLNRLDFGDILDSLWAANDTNFNLKHTAKDLQLASGAVTWFRKHAGSQLSFLVENNNTDVRFKWYNTNAIREITWAGVLLDTNEHEYDFHYDGSIDTNNGLDRVSFYIDGVLQGSKSLTDSTTGGEVPWPFGIINTTAPLRIGPNIAQVKDILVTSANDTVTEISVPLVRTGEDVSGNNRDGTWG